MVLIRIEVRGVPRGRKEARTDQENLQPVSQVIAMIGTNPMFSLGVAQQQQHRRQLQYKPDGKLNRISLSHCTKSMYQVGNMITDGVRNVVRRGRDPFQ